ncbi:MAG TPA: phosphatase PAP2 family protein [Gaiellaceae bacterium]
MLTPIEMTNPRTAQPAPSWRSGLRPVARLLVVELAIWAAAYGGYLTLRGLTIGNPAEAHAHAGEVVRAERALGLFHEASLQGGLGAVADVFSTYYLLGFGPVLGLVIVWLGLRRPELYRELRTVLLVSLALASVAFVFFPTAPPRLVAGLGITDTVGLSGHDTGSFAGIRFDPYAAMPSMHVGWALLAGLYGFRAARSRLLRLFFLLHPAVMAVAVSATGNHYFLDSAAGVAVAGLALALVWLGPRLSLRRQTTSLRGRAFMPELAVLRPRARWSRPAGCSALDLERSAA